MATQAKYKCAACGTPVSDTTLMACPVCGVDFTKVGPLPLVADPAPAPPVAAPAPILVRTYKAKNQNAAAAAFQADAQQLALRGYFPVSQSWAQGSWGCGAFIVAVLLFLLLVGILIFVYMLLVKPDGTLTVTYQYRAPATQS